jgi:hypothetical protein
MAAACFMSTFELSASSVNQLNGSLRVPRLRPAALCVAGYLAPAENAKLALAVCLGATVIFMVCSPNFS